MIGFAADGAAGPLVYLISGEPSGDILGERLMESLRQLTGGRVRFAGIGGERMCGPDFESLFSMSELSHMGLAEIVPHLPALLRRMGQTVRHVESLKPDVLVTLDAPGFNLRVAKRLRAKHIPLIHFVAPTVWAWKAWRAKEMAGYLDHLMTLLPFEPAYFEAVGLPATFVGHPVLESGADKGGGPSFRDRHGIDPDAPLLCLLPGSRMGEVTRLLPVMTQVVERLLTQIPALKLAVGVGEGVAGLVTQAIRDWPGEVITARDEREKFDCFAATDLALAASGTVALELAMAGTPSITVYKMSPLTGWIAKRMVRVDHVNLVNILLDREAVPGFVVGFVVFHEMLHGVMGAAQRGQRRVFHTAEFRAREADHPSYHRAQQWIEGNMDALLSY